MRSSIIPLSFGLLVLSGFASTPARAIHLTECTEKYEFTDAMDYLAPKDQERIHGIEHNHLNSDVENLVKGQSTSHAGGDLRFIVNLIPNHHRALAALIRLAQTEGTETPAESGPYTVRCWIDRAVVFSPRDGTLFLLYGVYLARNGLQREAVKQLEAADKLLPDNAEVKYNLGLVHFGLKDYKTSRQYAERAYALGFPLPGLKQKLAAVGQSLE